MKKHEVSLLEQVALQVGYGKVFTLNEGSQAGREMLISKGDNSDFREVFALCESQEESFSYQGVVTRLLIASLAGVSNFGHDHASFASEST